MTAPKRTAFAKISGHRDKTRKEYPANLRERELTPFLLTLIAKECEPWIRLEEEQMRMRMSAELIYPEEAYAIIGACLEVYNVMGCGFLEAVYQKCLERELMLRCIPFDSQKRLSLTYKGYAIDQDYTPDLVCYGKIIVELKAASDLIDANRAQTINYLNATGFQLGLLVNFGHHKSLEWERLAFTERPEKSIPRISAKENGSHFS